MKTNTLLKGKAHELFKLSDISNIRIAVIKDGDNKILRTSFKDDYSITYQQDELPSGELITNKVSTYGTREILTELNGKWSHQVI